MLRVLRFGAGAATLLLGYACSATGKAPEDAFGGVGGEASGSSSAQGAGGKASMCGTCAGKVYTPCDANQMPGAPKDCGAATCAAGLGCVACAPGALLCVGNEVHQCASDGGKDTLVETCDVDAGMTCSNGKCSNACDLAKDQPSNIGCEFWAVDLDQQDAFNDPASAPWGVAISNAGKGQANVTIELNEAPVGQPLKTKVVEQFSVPAGVTGPGDPAHARARLRDEAERLCVPGDVFIVERLPHHLLRAHRGHSVQCLRQRLFERRLPPSSHQCARQSPSNHQLGRGAPHPRDRDRRSLVRHHRRRHSRHQGHGQADLPNPRQSTDRRDHGRRGDRRHARALRRTQSGDRRRDDQ